MDNVEAIIKKFFHTFNITDVNIESIKAAGEEKVLLLIKNLVRDKERQFTTPESVQHLVQSAIFFKGLSFHQTYNYLKYLSDLVSIEVEVRGKILKYLLTSPFGKQTAKYTPMDFLHISNAQLNLLRDELAKSKKIKKEHLVSIIYENKIKSQINYDMLIQHYSSCICASLKYFFSDKKNKIISIDERTSIDHTSLLYDDDTITDFSEYITHNNTWCVSDFYFRRSFYFEDDVSNSIKKIHKKIKFNQLVMNSPIFLEMSLYDIPCPKNEYLYYDTIHNYNFKKSKRNYKTNNIYLKLKEQIQDILFLDIDNDSFLLHGLTLREWCLGYIVALNIIQNHNKTNFFKISKNFLAQELMEIGVESLEKSERIIDKLSFSSNSKDLFDTPFIQSKDGFVYMFKAITELLDPLNALISNLGSINADLSIKGEGFERFIRESLNKKGLNCSQYHSKIKINNKIEEYEYDALFCHENTLFIIECKNTFVSFSDMTKAYRIKKMIDNSVIQVSRLREGACILKSEIEEKLNNHFDKNKIITIVVNCLPINFKKKDNTYIISKESLLWALTHHCKRKFSSEDFIKNLELVSNQEETIRKIKSKHHLFVINTKDGIISTSMDIE